MAIECFADARSLSDSQSSLSITKLVDEIIKADYPSRLAGLTIGLYLAVRLATQNNAVGQPIYPTRSLVAGCGSANNYARLTLYPLLDHIARKWQFVQAREWVDDVVLRMEASSMTIARNLPNTIAHFYHGVTNLELHMSPKSVLTASDRGLRLAILDEVKREKVILKGADSAPDLGVQRGSKRRVRGKHVGRMAAGGRRGTRIARLVKGTKSATVAKKLMRTGAIPSTGYDGKVHGYPPSDLTKIRRGCGKCCHGYKAGRCLTTTLVIEEGILDPGIQLPLGLFDAWFSFWTKKPKLRPRVAATWQSVF